MNRDIPYGLGEWPLLLLIEPRTDGLEPSIHVAVRLQHLVMQCIDLYAAIDVLLHEAGEGWGGIRLPCQVFVEVGAFVGDVDGGGGIAVVVGVVEVVLIGCEWAFL
jgi:hypothetical protein